MTNNTKIMKQIQPIQYTTNGNLATQISVVIVNDNLQDSCSFSWTLFDSTGAVVDTGVLQCLGDDYAAWSGDNSYPYTFVANQLKLLPY